MSAKRRLTDMHWFALPDDIQSLILTHLDPISLASFERTCRAVVKCSEAAWHRLVLSYFQLTLCNPPIMDPTWSWRATFRFLFLFEAPHRPPWVWRLSTCELLREVHAMTTNAYPSFWPSDDGDYEAIDDVCQTLRHLAPDFQAGPAASVDSSFEAYVGLLATQVNELGQRGVVAQPWMLRQIKPGDVLHHLEVSDLRRDFWRVMAITNGIVLMQPLGSAADSQGRWNSFPRQITRSQLLFDYFMAHDSSAGCGRLTTPAWHSAQRRLSWEFSLLMVYGNEDP
jgi:hypothetical protein